PGTRANSRVAEMALAHAVSDKVEAAYRRGDLFQRRRQIMTDWAAFWGLCRPRRSTNAPRRGARSPPHDRGRSLLQPLAIRRAGAPLPHGGVPSPDEPRERGFRPTGCPAASGENAARPATALAVEGVVDNRAIGERQARSPG